MSKNALMIYRERPRETRQRETNITRFFFCVYEIKVIKKNIDMNCFDLNRAIVLILGKKVILIIIIMLLPV